VLDVLVAISADDVSEDIGVDTIARLHQELRRFVAQQGARVTPGD
jgi:hypothetical protein